MTTLIEKIRASATAWRLAHFPHDDYPAIGEILEWAAEPEGFGFQLRASQLRALEVYWFLRLIEATPKIADLYDKYFPAEDPDALLKALGIPDAASKTSKYNFPALWKGIARDDDRPRAQFASPSTQLAMKIDDFDYDFPQALPL